MISRFVCLDPILCPGAFFDLPYSMASQSWRVPLRYDLRLFGKCTLSFVRLKLDLPCRTSPHG
jgi:hypothetical protein